MSAEVWAIIGVIVGTVGTGGIGLIQATLQRKWSVDDRESTWEQEKRSRLFDAKRAAHEEFLEALNRLRGIVLESVVSNRPVDEHPDYGPSSMEMMHLQARLYIYASAEASNAAGEVASAVSGTSDIQDRAREQTDYGAARARYLYFARVDTEVEEDSGITLEALKDRAEARRQLRT